MGSGKRENSMKKGWPIIKSVAVVFGTRPEAIKMAPLVRELRANPDKFEVTVCVTGQHRQMLDQVLDVLDIAVDIDLNLMKHNQDLTDVTSSVMTSIRDKFSLIKPDIVLVHGDTTTALATAMTCFYLGIPVAHVEAGLRSFDISAPFPEEFNRQVISKLATLHFAPTAKNKRNLISEGVQESKIFVTGNTVIDSLEQSLLLLNQNSLKRDDTLTALRADLGFDPLQEEFVLITGHRRENFGDGFLNICGAISDLAENFPLYRFVYPVHLNPNVQKPVMDLLGALNNVYLVKPLDYLSFIVLLNNCTLVLTDSGGIQEEAPTFGKPIVLMRDTTERMEAIEAGTAVMVGSSKSKIVHEVTDLLTNSERFREMSTKANPFGDGLAAKRIIGILDDY